MESFRRFSSSLPFLESRSRPRKLQVLSVLGLLRLIILMEFLISSVISCFSSGVYQQFIISSSVYWEMCGIGWTVANSSKVTVFLGFRRRTVKLLRSSLLFSVSNAKESLKELAESPSSVDFVEVLLLRRLWLLIPRSRNEICFFGLLLLAMGGRECEEDERECVLEGMHSVGLHIVFLLDIVGVSMVDVVALLVSLKMGLVGKEFLFSVFANCMRFMKGFVLAFYVKGTENVENCRDIKMLSFLEILFIKRTRAIFGRK